jgi:biogenesis of lysosome-related organelles complex 1 subunit KXD1
MPSQPITMPSKGSTPMYPYGQTDYSRISSSPPEGTDTASSGGPSYDPTAISGSYAASASDYEASSGLASIDLLDLMNERLQGSYDPITMDQTLVQQVQTYVLN